MKENHRSFGMRNCDSRAKLQMLYDKTMWSLWVIAGILAVTGGMYARTIMMGDENDIEVPSLAFDKAYVLSRGCIGTNDHKFVCTQAISILSKHHGGWKFTFVSDSCGKLSMHIDERGDMVVNNIIHMSPGKVSPSPSLSIHEVIESVFQFHRGILLRIVWNEISNVWHVRLMDQSGKRFSVIVDAQKKVKILSLKDGKYPSASDIKVEVDDL